MDVIRIRTGRKNPHTLYLQGGSEPNDADLFLGSCVTPEAAAKVVEMANAGLGSPPLPQRRSFAQMFRDGRGRIQ